MVCQEPIRNNHFIYDHFVRSRYKITIVFPTILLRLLMPITAYGYLYGLQYFNVTVIFNAGFPKRHLLLKQPQFITG
jgi:hypothetical protein